MKAKMKQQGMTLIEIVITVSVIGLLAAFILPAVSKAMERRDGARAASKMRIAVNAFELCKAETGSYPLDRNRAQIPPEMTDYFADLGIDWWTVENELGGKWDWDKDNNFPYSISIVDPTSSQKALQDLDAMLDDGDLETGTFRKIGTRYHYILEE